MSPRNDGVRNMGGTAGSGANVTSSNHSQSSNGVGDGSMGSGSGSNKTSRSAAPLPANMTSGGVYVSRLPAWKANLRVPFLLAFNFHIITPDLTWLSGVGPWEWLFPVTLWTTVLYAIAISWVLRKRQDENEALAEHQEVQWDADLAWEVTWAATGILWRWKWCLSTVYSYMLAPPVLRLGWRILRTPAYDDGRALLKQRIAMKRAMTMSGYDLYLPPPPSPPLTAEAAAAAAATMNGTGGGMEDVMGEAHHRGLAQSQQHQQQSLHSSSSGSSGKRGKKRRKAALASLRAGARGYEIDGESDSVADSRSSASSSGAGVGGAGGGASSGLSEPHLRGFILVPGCLIESSAYAALAAHLSDEGIVVAVLSTVPLRWAKVGAKSCGIAASARRADTYIYNARRDIKALQASIPALATLPNMYPYKKQTLVTSTPESAPLSPTNNNNNNGSIPQPSTATTTPPAPPPIEWIIGGHSMGGYAALNLMGPLQITRAAVFGSGNKHPLLPDLTTAAGASSERSFRVLHLEASEDYVCRFKNGQRLYFDRKLNGGAEYDSSGGDVTTPPNRKAAVQIKRRIIEGGTHAGYASYPPSKYDVGKATISKEEQQRVTAVLIGEFILKQKYHVSPAR